MPDFSFMLFRTKLENQNVFLTPSLAKLLNNSPVSSPAWGKFIPTTLQSLTYNCKDKLEGVSFCAGDATGMPSCSARPFPTRHSSVQRGRSLRAWRDAGLWGVRADVRACGAKLRSGGRQLLLESTGLGKSLESNYKLTLLPAELVQHEVHPSTATFLSSSSSPHSIHIHD